MSVCVWCVCVCMCVMCVCLVCMGVWCGMCVFLCVFLCVCGVCVCMCVVCVYWGAHDKQGRWIDEGSVLLRLKLLH